MNLIKKEKTVVFPVDARELHKELGSKKDFTDWVKYKIKVGGFVEGEDFIVFHKFGENSKGGRPRKDFKFSVNMAKHISQMEGTKKGYQVREYFIKAEEALHDTKTLADEIVRRQVASMRNTMLENVRLQHKVEFLKHFKPKGKPGEIAKNGLPKDQFRRGYYVSKNGQDTSVLLEHPELPGLFEQFEIIGSQQGA